MNLSKDQFAGSPSGAADETQEESGLQAFLEGLPEEKPVELELGGLVVDPERRICEPGDDTCDLALVNKPRDSGPAPTGGGAY